MWDRTLEEKIAETTDPEARQRLQRLLDERRRNRKKKLEKVKEVFSDNRSEKEVEQDFKAGMLLIALYIGAFLILLYLLMNFFS